MEIVVVPSPISALRWHFAEERLCHCGEAETRRGHRSRLAAVVAPRRMQVADRAEKFWPHNEEANLDNVQEERVFPLLSLGSTHPSTFSNTEDRRWWCSQTRLPLTWPGSRLGCSSVLLAASACCCLLQSLSELPPAAVTSRHTVTSNTHSCTLCSTISSLLSLTEALILGNIFFSENYSTTYSWWKYEDI